MLFRSVVFDKTGTLTKGIFKVKDVVPTGIDRNELLRIAAHAEVYSTHPIAVSILKEYGNDVDESVVKDVNNIPGQGIIASVSGKEVRIGNSKLVPQGAGSKEVTDTIVHVSVDGTYAGYITIADVVKEDSWNVVSDLNAIGVHRVVMLTGDNKEVGERTAEELGIKEVYTEMLPQDKVGVTERLMKETKGKLVFVGDGVNDAPVLARSDIGIAMGGLGSDAAIEAADVVMMTDEPSKVASGIKISRRTVKIAKQNIVFALAVKAFVMMFGLIGMATMWEAVFADVGVTLIAVFNSMRALTVK